jgi:hypothetical protein
MKNSYDCLLSDVCRSIRYHSKRAAFFGYIVRFTKAFSLFTGFGTITALIGESYVLSIVCGAFVALVSALDLACGFSDREKLHDDLKRRFIHLEKDLVLGESKATEEWIKLKTSDRLMIEVDEPPVIKTLDIICHNEQAIAQGNRKDVYHLNWLRKLFKQFDLPLLDINRLKKEKYGA